MSDRHVSEYANTTRYERQENVTLKSMQSKKSLTDFLG